MKPKLKGSMRMRNDQRLAQNATLTLPRLRDSRGRFVSDGGFFVPKWARAEIM
jgi:hypothetical protein